MPGRVKLAVTILWLQAVGAAVIAAVAFHDAATLGLPRRSLGGSTMHSPLQDQILRTMSLELGKITAPLSVALIVAAVAAIVRRPWARWLAIGGELPLLVVGLLGSHSSLADGEPQGLVLAVPLIGSVVLVLRPLLSKPAAEHYSGGSSPERMSSASTMR
jgi:ABC-type Fe3+ transport system permease subunit